MSKGKLVNLAGDGSSQTPLPPDPPLHHGTHFYRLGVNRGVNRCGFVKRGIESEGTFIDMAVKINKNIYKKKKILGWMRGGTA